MQLGLVAAVVLFMQGNPIVPLTPPQNVTVTNQVTVVAPEPDPEAIAEASTQSFQAITVNLIAPTLVSWVDGMLDVPDFLRTTPPDLTYNHPAVRGLSELARLGAGALLALFVLGFGISHALGQQPSPGRFLFAAVLAFFELIWWQIGIDLTNAINGGISAPAIRDVIRPHLTLPAITADPVAAFGPALLVIVYAVVALLLLISAAFRLGLIDILIAIGPLALLCAATEETSGLYQTYTRISIGTTLSQIPMVVALSLAPILGALGTGIAGTLLGLVVLLLARQMPSLLVAGGRGSTAGRIATTLVLRRLILRR
jgi:hypothetical protein